MIIRRLDIMSDVESAYLAGLIDGDGCVNMGPVGNSPGSFRISAQITSKDKMLIDYVYQTTGVGHVRPNNYKGRHAWRWDVTSHKDVILLIKRVHPYIVLKKKVCELIYTMATKVKQRSSTRPLTDDEIMDRWLLFKEYKSLMSHQPIIKRGEFGETPERTIPSQAPNGEGVEVSPEIKDISTPPEKEEMTRAAEGSVEVGQR